MGTEAKPVIQVKNLYKVYRVGDSHVRALDGVNLEIYKGEFCSIVGTSGSGKSTLLNMLAGLEKPTKGEIIIAGEHMENKTENQLVKFRREHIGFIFQSFNLVPTLTAAENITLPTDIAGKDVNKQWFEEVTSRLGLAERLEHRPAELSGGQQQRVACARALVSRPEIIFGDEPTGNLDSNSSAEVLNILRTAVDKDNQTVVIVTHDAKAASYADRVVFLADGKLVNELHNPTMEAIHQVMAEIEG